MLGRALVLLCCGKRGWPTVECEGRPLEGVPIREESSTPRVVLKIGNKMCDRTESKVVKRHHEMR